MNQGRANEIAFYFLKAVLMNIEANFVEMVSQVSKISGASEQEVYKMLLDLIVENSNESLFGKQEEVRRDEMFWDDDFYNIPDKYMHW